MSAGRLITAVLAPFKIVSGKIQSQFMTQLTLPRLSILRGLVVVAALFTLCVSSNVGPRFLPLPTLEKYAAENLQQTIAATASHSHCTGEASFRVPMAQGQKRADRELQAQPLAVLPGTHFIFSNNSRLFAELAGPDHLFSLAPASLPPGRAPPRLV
jgi:hypothetical protein